MQKNYINTIRSLFVLAAVVMVVTLPFFYNRLKIDFYLLAIFIVGISLLAGFTSVRRQWTSILDMGVSIFGLVFFEYYAVVAYLNYWVSDGWFWVNEVLAVIFFFALYFSTRTLRGKILGRS